jgi:hypothetical protein
VLIAVSVVPAPAPRRLGVSIRGADPVAAPKSAAPRGSDAGADAGDDPIAGLDAEASRLALPGFEFDLRKVAEHARSLFPFLRLERFSFPRVAPHDPGAAGPLASLFGRMPDERPRAPLVLGDAALQVLVDSAWSRRERWRPFQGMVSFANRYNAQTGRVPDLLRRYVEENALQPYVDPSARDPRLWVELGIAADHRDFVEFVNRYASEHASTRAAVELLFLLDKLAQGSFDALITLLDIRPVEDLHLTLQANRDAFNLILLLQRYYRAELERLDLATRYALRTL